MDAFHLDLAPVRPPMTKVAGAPDDNGTRIRSNEEFRYATALCKPSAITFYYRHDIGRFAFN
jgi:hypothetical protein